MSASQQLKNLLEKECLTLDAQLQHFEKDNQEKTKEFSDVQEELVIQLLENHAESEKAIVYQKLIEKKERDVDFYKENSKKKMLMLDDLVKKHQSAISARGTLRDRSVETLRRMIIADEFHFGNMENFRIETKAKRAKLATEILEARNELAEKKKMYETLEESLKQVQCPEISAYVKRDFSEECQTILKEGRKRLLALKMENRALWMKLKHNA